MAPLNENQISYLRRLLDTRKRTRSDIVKIVRDVKEITLKESKRIVHWIKHRKPPPPAQENKSQND